MKCAISCLVLFQSEWYFQNNVQHIVMQEGGRRLWGRKKKEERGKRRGMTHKKRGVKVDNVRTPFWVRERCKSVHQEKKKNTQKMPKIKKKKTPHKGKSHIPYSYKIIVKKVEFSGKKKILKRDRAISTVDNFFLVRIRYLACPAGYFGYFFFFLCNVSRALANHPFWPKWGVIWGPRAFPP